ncbi:hypothetical protein TNCV_2811201, partial [Trichonephila clavipes]
PFVAYPHRPMTLHSPHRKNSLCGVESQDLGKIIQGPKREIRRSPNVSFNKSIVARAVTCCAALLNHSSWTS